MRILPFVTGISSPPADWPHKHLTDRELRWFDFDPSALADFVRRFGPEYPDLPERLMECRRAAWQCGSYVRFVERRPGRDAGVITAVISNETYTDEFQEYGIDIDKDGKPFGVELLHRTCMDP